MTVHYLVTGANRGVGLGLVIELAKRPDAKIFATARDPARVPELQAVAEKHGITILKWRADHEEDSAALVTAIQETTDRVDVVIANAGVFSHPDPVLKTPLKNFTYDFAVNAGGPLHLLQAIYSLLQKSSLEGGAVWAPISSCLGSIAESPNMPALAYGASKAALNYTSKRLAVEHPELKVLIIHPGDVRTEMARGVAAKAGFAEIPGTISVEESASQIVALVERAGTYESGVFVDYKGDAMAW